uniref:Uncharacterized protein n=1 Tax=Acrobeloides nanus TaxID=290746 RepID=A0A914C4U9_9BILA
MAEWVKDGSNRFLESGPLQLDFAYNPHEYSQPFVYRNVASKLARVTSIDGSSEYSSQILAALASNFEPLKNEVYLETLRLALASTCKASEV